MGENIQSRPISGDLRDIDTMREVHRRQLQLGHVPIEKIWIEPKSRDGIPERSAVEPLADLVMVPSTFPARHRSQMHIFA